MPTISPGRAARGPALAAILSLALPVPAAAQAVEFDPADYGRTRLPERQSTGDAARYIAANDGGAFEPVAELSPGERMAVLARPIGRLDVLLEDVRTGEQGGAACSAALIGDGFVLTNHHCLPQAGELRPVEASIVMDFLTLDGTGAERFRIDPVPLEWDAALDYAIVRVEGAPSERYGRLALGAPGTAGGVSRTVVHHPLGRPKMMSRFRCRTVEAATPPPGAGVPHRCDTLPGSSGSILFDDGGRAVALHREGGLTPDDPTSFNVATDMGALLAVSERLADVARAADAPATPAAPPAAAASASDGLSTGDMNSILRGD